MTICSLGLLSMVLLSWLPGLQHKESRLSKLATQDIRVVVSTKPLYSLISGIMQGVAKPYLLMDPQQSPHTYNFRPSDIEKLSQADLVVWVGPSIETFMAAALRDHRAPVLTLEREPSLQLRPLRQNKDWEATCAHHHGADNQPEPIHDKQAHHHHEHGHHAHDHSHHHEHDHAATKAVDGHFWLDPDRTITMLHVVTQQLSTLDPVHAQVYQQNAAKLIERLQDMKKRLLARLAPLKGLPFIVFHDAYQYFEAWTGLRGVGSVVVDHDMPLGSKHIQDLITRTKTQGIRCIFHEPQFSPRLAKTLAQQAGCTTTLADPLGADISDGVDGYFELMDQLAGAFEHCLKNPQSLKTQG